MDKLKIRENFKTVVDELLKTGHIKNYQEFADKIKEDQSNISSMMNGKRLVSPKMLSGLFNAFPLVNKDYIYEGKGAMLKDVSIEKSDNSYRLVPLKNMDAIGGTGKHNEVTPSEPEYITGWIPFNDAQKDDICIPVTGNSMEPTCPSGSIILIRQVEKWREYFGYGNIFVLILKDGRRILKEIAKHEVNHGEYVMCVSHNKSIQPEELPKSMIDGVWKVIKILTDHGY